MQKLGILLHVYHLGAAEWERLVWGDPAADELGTGTRYVECLLDIPADQTVVSIVYSGPSQKNGLIEGAYTKQYIIDRLDTLGAFPRLKWKLDQLTEAEYALFVERVHGMVVGPVIKNTLAELENAAVFFREEGVGQVIQVAAATHAPRCLRDQLTLRHNGVIDKNQRWYMAAADRSFSGATPADVVIAEPLHRPDDAMRGVSPSWSELLKLYAGLHTENKKFVIRELDKVMAVAQAREAQAENMSK